MLPPLALYIHWPYCRSKCPYCDFNSHVSDNHQVPKFAKAYAKALKTMAVNTGPRQVTSIFFGGGTPSLMPTSLVAEILGMVAEVYACADDMEVTLEANPTSVEAERLSAYLTAGVNRLSLGVQALDPAALKFLGREHSADEAKAAVMLVRELTPRYSFDLMYARPGQSLAAWRDELEEALTMASTHMSLYQLTIEKGTPFYRAYQQGEFQLPAEEEAAELWEWTGARMLKAGMPLYEISNYAASGAESRHNLAYWRYHEYLGIGPGAHSRVVIDGRRQALMMHHQPDKWLAAVAEDGAGIQQRTVLDQATMMAEWLMMGLRTVEGIDAGEWEHQFQQPLLDRLQSPKAQGLLADGRLRFDGGRLCLSLEGMLLHGQVVAVLS
jgi:putative oxygen-independent coproporphyrinogen III oxidase